MVSEIRLLDFFTQTLKLPEGQAREAVREFKTAEAEMHAGFTENIDKKFEERKDILATKQDIRELEQRISSLEVRFEHSINRMLIWVVSSIFAAAGLVIAAIKLL